SRPWPEKSEVTVLSVYEAPILPAMDGWMPDPNYFEDLLKAAENQAQDIVRKAADEIQKSQGDKLRVIARAVEGHARFAILSEAEEWGADLILLGSHGYRGFTKLWIGSVSQAVASHAKCSVEIVRDRNPDKKA